MCSWSNTQNANADKLDWELTSPEAESHYPIPPEDHSLGTEKGNPDFWQCMVVVLPSYIWEFQQDLCNESLPSNFLSARSLPVLSKQQPDSSQ